MLRTHHNPLTKDEITEYEKIDKIKTEAMKFAERNCRKLHMGGIWWCPELQHIRDTILYYKLSISRKKRCKVGARILKRLSKKTGINAENQTLKELEINLSRSFKQYKEKRKHAKDMRKNFIESLAEELERRGKGKKARLVKHLTNIEDKRTMFRKLATIYGKNQDLSTSYITVKENGISVDITERKKMEERITEENRKKYHQTEDTCPFKSDLLYSDFGPMGIGPKTSLLLEGKYTPSPLLSKYTQEFLETCNNPLPPPQTKLKRTLEEYKNSWRKMREKTSSNSLHFGHYKAATYDKKNLSLNFALAELPFRTGFSPSRWHSATNVMILKAEGNTELDSLRTLALFESDYNHNNKFLGKEMMKHCNHHNLLATEQYSIPGKKCIDHVLNKRLLFDITRYQKTSLALSSVDLKSCYDRISHAPAFLAMTSMGIPQEPIISMFSTLQNVKYQTKTVHGLSTCTFGGKEDGYKHNPNGMGQGNGAGPPVWAVVSTKMFEVLKRQGLASHLSCPISKDQLEICGFAFVDDSDIISTSNSINDPNYTLQKMQNVLEGWEGAAKATGGAIKAEKSWAYLVYFTWDKGLWSYGNTSNLKELTTLDHANKEVNIKRLDTSQAKKMLGVWLAPDGNNIAQIDYLKKRAEELSEFIRTGHVNRREAWVSLNVMAMKTIEYCLPATSFSEKELNEIMKPLLKQFLPKTGLNRNTRRDILYGDETYQGHGFKKPVYSSRKSTCPRFH